MTDKIFVMLCGVPTSGKSTYIENNPDYSLLPVASSDYYIEAFARAMKSTYSNVFRDAISLADKFFMDQIASHIERGESFIVDRTNLTPKARRRIIDMIPSDYIKIAVNFTTPTDDVFKSRNLVRNEQGKYIPFGVFKTMAENYVPATTNEGFDKIYHV